MTVVDRLSFPKSFAWHCSERGIERGKKRKKIFSIKINFVIHFKIISYTQGNKDALKVYKTLTDLKKRGW